MAEDGSVQTRRPLVLRVVLPLILVSAGVVTWTYYPELRGAVGYLVPAHEGTGSCRVQRGDAEATVRANCGVPCGRGAVPSPATARGWPRRVP